MKAILEQPVLRHDLIGKGTQVLSRFSIGEMAAKFKALYDKTAAPSFKHEQPLPTSAGI
jgi:hypothetical protein